MCPKCPPPERMHASERLLRTRPTFSETVMVSVGVSKLGCTEMFFCRAGVKINGVYYRDVLLMQKLMPVIRQISGNEFVFQQDSAPAHRAHETIELLCRDTYAPDFISPEQWPPNSPDLNPVDYKIWATVQTVQQRVYQTKIRNANVDELRHCLLNVWSSIE